MALDNDQKLGVLIEFSIHGAKHEPRFLQVCKLSPDMLGARYVSTGAN